jgi:hypothetical protein
MLIIEKRRDEADPWRFDYLEKHVAAVVHKDRIFAHAPPLSLTVVMAR